MLLIATIELFWIPVHFQSLFSLHLSKDSIHYTLLMLYGTSLLKTDNQSAW